MKAIQEALEKTGKAATLARQDLARCFEGEIKVITGTITEEDKSRIIEQIRNAPIMIFRDHKETIEFTSYQQGYEQGVKDLAEQLKKFYTSFRSHTYSATVAYHVEQIKKDLLKKGEKNEVQQID